MSANKKFPSLKNVPLQHNLSHMVSFGPENQEPQAPVANDALTQRLLRIMEQIKEMGKRIDRLNHLD